MPDKKKGLLMRHNSCSLTTTEAVDDLPEAHSVGKKDMILKEKMVLWVNISYRNVMDHVQTET